MKRLIPAMVFMATGLAAVSAQETAAGSAPASASQPTGQLSPPADNAPATTAPAAPAAPDAAPAAATIAVTTPTTTPSTPARKLTARELSEVRQTEIIRRQDLIFRGNESLKLGRKAEVGQNYPEARKDYLFAVQAYSSLSRSTSSYATAAEGLTRVDLQLYDSSLKAGDLTRAKKLIDEIIEYNPKNKEANEKLLAINRAINNPNDVSLYGNIAVTPGFVGRVNEVQKLFAEAEQFRRTGQWDEAEARLKRILGIDPYNIAATKQLERIDQEKLDYDEHGRLETRTERLRQVEEKWSEPIINKDSTSSAQDGQPTLIAHTNFGLDQELKSLFVSLDFNNATIEEATNFLSIESKRLDPNKKGINFIIQPEASTNAKPVTITLNNVPLGEALRYVCQLANVKFKVQDYAISIVPYSVNTDDLISRNFLVEPDFVAPPLASGTLTAASTAAGLGGDRPLTTTPDKPAIASTGDTIKDALIAKGVKFPPGASAVYTPSTGQLTVVNTADQMELLDELVHAGQAPVLMVRIATKFVEINQTDLQDLTINSSFNFFTGQIPVIASQTPQYATALPGSLGFGPNSIDALIAPQGTQLNTLAFRTFINAAQLNFLVTALSQKKSFDLLSEPAILTKSGDQGVLEAVRVFPYPISFDPPELVTQTAPPASTAAGGVPIVAATFSPPSVIAATPTDFKRRNVGVRLVIKPQVTADNRTVDLSLFPEVTDFEGFINYGDAIFVANPDGSRSLLSTNEINQPVFNTRRINTKILVKDGSTVVLGGLIRDDVQTINDKVPILGDIPLIGRLFQSKATSNTKRNLIIFVTANIYRNDGELLNEPEVSNTADIITGRAGFAPVAAQ